MKKFYLVTFISGKTLTDQTVEQHIRAILVITVITEYSTVTTKKFLKKCLFFPPHTFSFFTSWAVDLLQSTEETVSFDIKDIQGFIP